MLKIKALNDESSTSEEDQVSDANCSQLETREAIEERWNCLYAEALKQLRDDNIESAKESLLKLYDMLKNSENGNRVESYDKLLFLTLKNLGMICTDNIDYFFEALNIDDKDISLWLKTGDRAYQVFKNFPLARNCFENCLNLSPQNWIAIDKLIDMYFILSDLTNCFLLCVEALKLDESYPKAQVLIAEIAVLFPPIIKDMSEAHKKYMVVSSENKEYSEKLLSSLRGLKSKRKNFLDEQRAEYAAKRRQTVVTIEVTPNLSVTELGVRILKLYQKMNDQQISTATAVEVLFESKQKESDDGISADENGSNEENDKEKPKSSSRNSSNSFPVEFLDKRRSSRVQRIQTRTRDSCDSITEKLLQLLPPSIISRRQNISESSVEEREVKPDAEIESEVIRRFISKQQCYKKSNCLQRIFDIISDYLCEVSKCASQLKIPDEFLKLYKLHRSQNTLPFVAYSVIGKDISLDDIWLTLVANEIHYTKCECMFLTEVSMPLEVVIEEDKHDEFIVRLMVLRGTKESCVDFLEYALNILNKKSQQITAGNRTLITTSSLKSLINSKSGNSLIKLLEEEKYNELIEHFSNDTELSDVELKMVSEAVMKAEKWEKGLEIVSCSKKLNNEYLKLLKICVETGKRAKFNFNLTKRIVEIAVESYSVLPWICLYWAFESERIEFDIEDNFISFINTAHQYLGKKGVCTSHDGEFLLNALDFLINHSSSTKDDLILQCFSCLYNHPPRKNAYLQAHPGAPQVTLTWQHAELIYSYFIPEELPEFDTLYKNNTINSDTELLLTRIACLVPNSMNPKNQIKRIENYIETGNESELNVTLEKHNVTHHLYYLLADYYFKNKEFKKAKLYYKLDLCLNCDRFDSWAASALVRSSLLDQHLISGDNPIYKNPDKFYKATESAFRCYSRALKLDPSNTKLWIEYGNLAYNISSHASRLKKSAIYGATLSKSNSKEDAERFEQKRKEMLQIAKYCFESANNTDCKDEIWLHYYFLGKIAEKSDLLLALHYYELADLYLFLNSALYPKKISYHNPSYLSIEALEIHYRIHCSALKFLSSTHRLTRKALQKIKVFLIRAFRSPFVKQINSSLPTILDHDYTSGALNSSSNSFGRTIDTVSELLNDMLDIVSERIDKVDENKMKASLIEMCMNAMKRCLIRFGPHYKSLYRLAYYAYTTGDVQSAKNILMHSFTVPVQSHSFHSALQAGHQLEDIATCSTPDANQKTVTIAGLFSERKNNNLFNAIWRIPVDDIDRPGSFSTHMYRCTLLLLRICTAVFDYNNLCTIGIHLSKTPDTGKKYLRDADRLRLAREAFNNCSLMLKNQLVSSGVPREIKDRILVELLKVCDRFIKANVFVNEANLLITECYKLIHKS
ncbi:hypothetical protein B4U80_06573 [Leptotrombidium deliense]|uniref:Calcineurin-binding protein cabin-1-like protein n=1 Tax=Leptotrombidium deliense TaxID=299467 RepID=A0A443SUJ8_9ACAR|nr:hypothetical protein B4U80_06573 [Leptotrombidium deliense]